MAEVQAGLTVDQIAQIVAQLTQAVAAAQGASQTVQQAVQTANTLIADLTQKTSEQVASGVAASQVEQAETFSAEAIQAAAAGKTARLHSAGPDHAGTLFNNLKWLSDTCQLTHFTQLALNQGLFQNAANQAQKELATLNAVTTQHLQNAVNAAKQLDTMFASHYADASKQTSAHSDIATDRIWNVDEQSHIVSEILRQNTFKDAIAGAVAAAVAEIVAGKKTA